MTLDEFLLTLELLIEDRTEEDDPGEGNFDCRDCRACYNCRFCLGCGDCEDCTYCEESIECTSCTQCKRCISCEKASYCEDSRECKTSRYLTLCIQCTDCVHCLACVGLEGQEFCVLNEKRSRKEYFALLQQVKEALRVRHEAGWRAGIIGLASEVDDPRALAHDPELGSGPWLDEVFGRPRQGDELERFAADLQVDDELAIAGTRETGSPWLDDASSVSESPWLDEPPRRSLRRVGRPVRADGPGSESTGSPEQSEAPRAPGPPRGGLLTGRRPRR